MQVLYDALGILAPKKSDGRAGFFGTVLLLHKVENWSD